MYLITNALNGEKITTLERPTFVKRHSNGSLIGVPFDQAVGVVVDGTPYSLLGTPGVGEETLPIIITVADGGVQLDSLESGVIDLGDALCEEDTEIASRLSDIEDALCELDK